MDRRDYNCKLENLWGVWYRDGGGIKWHAHNSEEDIKYSFVYYIKVPENVLQYISVKIQQKKTLIFQ